MADFPIHPPARYFQRPEWLNPGQKLTVVDDGEDAGRVAGYVAMWDTCIIDGQPGCWNPPSSPTGYQGAMQGETLTAEGDTIATANIGGSVNHAPLTAGYRQAQKHYEHTAAQTLRVQFGEDEHGIWFAGVAWPEFAEDRALAMLRASAVSGDWRFRPDIGAVDMAGVQLVNNPGLPLRRVAGLSDEDTVFLGGIEDCAPCDTEPVERCDACDQPYGLEAHVAALGDRVADLEETVVTDDRLTAIAASISDLRADLADISTVAQSARTAAAAEGRQRLLADLEEFAALDQRLTDAGKLMDDLQAGLVEVADLAAQARTAALADRQRRLVVERDEAGLITNIVEQVEAHP